jgi:hypothetical protein
MKRHYATFFAEIHLDNSRKQLRVYWKTMFLVDLTVKPRQEKRIVTPPGSQ